MKKGASKVPDKRVAGTKVVPCFCGADFLQFFWELRAVFVVQNMLKVCRDVVRKYFCMSRTISSSSVGTGDQTGDTSKGIRPAECSTATGDC